MNKAALETHVVSALAVIGAALAMIHPGFKLPPDTAPIATTILLAGAVGLQWLHKWQKAPKGQKLAVVESAAKTVVGAVESGQATTTLETAKTTVSAVEADAKDVESQLASVTPIAPASTEAPVPPPA